MSNSMVNVTTSGASSNSTTLYLGLTDMLNIFNLSFGFPTHSYVIWLIVTGSGVASEFFTFNLSVCEIVYSLNIVFSMHVCSWDLSLQTLTRFLIGFAITGRPLFQCLISVERYLAVVHPVTFLKYKPLRYRVICCTVSWILIFGASLGCMFTLSLFYIYAWFFSLQFLLFLFIQMCFLVAVLRALKQSGPGESNRDEENHMKRRAFHIILITTVSMIIIYVPFIISGLCFILTQKYISELFTVGLLCFNLAAFVQPVLYLHRVGKLCCLCCS